MPTIDLDWWYAGEHQGQALPDILWAHDFGTVFTFLRQRGWSVGALSAATKIDEYPIREIIKGKRRVTAYDVIDRIVDGLKIPRHLCRVSGSSPSGQFDKPDSDLGERLAIARAVDSDIIATLADEVDNIRRIDRMIGARAADQQLTGMLTTLADLRSYSLSPSVREQLADLYCDVAALAAWVALDLGDIDRSWRHHESAKDAGHESGSSVALSHALAQQAYVLTDIGRNDDAVQLAAYALEVGTGATPPLLQAWLEAVVGDIAAHAGHAANSDRHFDSAAQIIPSDPRDPALPYIMLDEFHLARWRGNAAARLGDEAAIADLNFALTGMDRSFVRGRAQLHVDLAHSLIIARHEDEAAKHVVEARTLASQVGSLRQRKRVHDVELMLDHPRN